MRQHLMTIFEFDTKIAGWKDLDDPALKFDMLFSSHRRGRTYAVADARSITTTMSLPSAEPSAAPAVPDPERFVSEPRELIRGNAVKLLRGGAEIFPAWLSAIHAARVRISLEMYIFSDDRIGRRFAEALMAAVKRGVRVNLMYDFVGCRDTPASFFQRLKEGGVHTVAYHRYRFWRPRFWQLLRRNHRKTLVCDGQIAFTGGLNISDEWMAKSDGGGGWSDAGIRIEGPAVSQMEEIFLLTWNRRARKKARVDPASLPRLPVAGDTRVVVISNRELLDRFAIRRAALHAIRESGRRVYIANPYFVPDRGVISALRQAAARGTSVRIIVPSRSDFRLLDMATRATFGRLLAAGVRIWQSAALIHTKAMAIDGAFASIGSYNFDHRSLAYNLEIVVNVLDQTCTSEVEAMLDSEIALGVELTTEIFARRSLLTRALERLAYGLRHWL
ncbi:MAG: cardiolipin synthase [Myxococcales bacterium]|nr:cardiolipin synthase [Myxococcales bacterium]